MLPTVADMSRDKKGGAQVAGKGGLASGAGNGSGRAIDTSKPNIARVYDYWLGGKDNFAADREVAARMLEQDPDLARRVRDNREFVTKVAGRAAERGVVQFIDLGAGLPARPSVHEAARAISPLARVVYVDNDPVVISHAQALLVTGTGLAAMAGDLRDPGAVLSDPVLGSVIDFSQPVCVILAAVAHFLPAAQAAGLAARYMAPLAAGSWLAVSCAHFTDEGLLAQLYAMHTTAPFQNHGTGELTSFLGGLDVLPPGIAEVRRWLSGVGGTPTGRSAYMLCGVGVKG
jgi:O-methyltransferase involved in polyketide biosynthesis